MFTAPTPACCYVGCPDCDDGDLDVPPDTGRTLAEKLRVFDAYADKARDELVRLLTVEWEYVKRLAAGRHANGHFLYGDSLMYEYDQPRLLVESVEELADGVNYTMLRLYRDLA